MLATLSFIVSALLDVANIIEVPNIFLVAAGLILTLVGRFVGPSWGEIEKANRRG